VEADRLCEQETEMCWVRYAVTEQERLVIGFRKWRHYLHGGPKFEIVTDHMALRWLMSFREPLGSFARRMAEVQEFDYEISHVPGSSWRENKFTTIYHSQ
jgi:RNase H-like domain found in reverse transcriptase